MGGIDYITVGLDQKLPTKVRFFSLALPDEKKSYLFFILAYF